MFLLEKPKFVILYARLYYCYDILDILQLQFDGVLRFNSTLSILRARIDFT